MTEDVITFLKRIRDERRELISIRMHKEDVRLSLLPGAIRYDKDRVDSSPDDPMIKMIERLEAIEAKEDACVEELITDIELANEVITAMTVPEHKTLLRLRYIDGDRPMHWKDIASEMGYTEDHVRGKLHGKAIAEARNIYAQKEHT